MSRRTPSPRTERLRSLSIVLCALAAIPLVSKTDGGHAAPGTRAAFQLLDLKPGQENQRAQRAIIAVVTSPLASF